MPVQTELQSLIVRPVHPDEEQQWNEWMADYHYLGFRKMVGESLKYVAEIDQKWVALLGWGAAAFQCRARDEWIGWGKEQQWKRLIYVANNIRFLILPWIRIPNLASKILSVNRKRLSADWLAVYAHPIVLTETFVDPSRFTGTCYRAAGWIRLGQTRGFARNAGQYYYHGVKKNDLCLSDTSKSLCVVISLLFGTGTERRRYTDGFECAEPREQRRRITGTTRSIERPTKTTRC